LMYPFSKLLESNCAVFEVGRSRNSSRTSKIHHFPQVETSTSIPSSWCAAGHPLPLPIPSPKGIRTMWMKYCRVPIHILHLVQEETFRARKKSSSVPGSRRHITHFAFVVALFSSPWKYDVLFAKPQSPLKRHGQPAASQNPWISRASSIPQVVRNA